MIDDIDSRRVETERKDKFNTNIINTKKRLKWHRYLLTIMTQQQQQQQQQQREEEQRQQLKHRSK